MSDYIPADLDLIRSYDSCMDELVELREEYERVWKALEDLVELCEDCAARLAEAAKEIREAKLF